MVGDVLMLGLAVFSVSIHLNRVEKIPICRGREQWHPERFTVHMNSEVIFGVNFYDVERFKMNCSCLLISPCELILVLLIENRII